MLNKKNKIMGTLVKNIIDWAEERNLLHYENAENQYLKFLEEVGETARACLKKDEAGIIDGFGDIAVTVIILAKQLGGEVSEVNMEIVRPTRPFKWFLDCVTEDSVSDETLDYLNDVSMFYGHSLETCLNSAWNEIKDRKGVTIDGIFTKNQ